MDGSEPGFGVRVRDRVRVRVTPMAVVCVV
jgi:hypothetical protein